MASFVSELRDRRGRLFVGAGIAQHRFHDLTTYGSRSCLPFNASIGRAGHPFKLP